MFSHLFVALSLSSCFGISLKMITFTDKVFHSYKGFLLYPLMPVQEMRNVFLGFVTHVLLVISFSFLLSSSVLV